MPPGVAKTDDQGKTRFGREKVENTGNPPFGASRFFAYMGCERLHRDKLFGNGPTEHAFDDSDVIVNVAAVQPPVAL